MIEVLKAAAFLLLAVLALLALIAWIGMEDTRCREAGGTFLWREGKCIDVEEIQP